MLTMRWQAQRRARSASRDSDEEKESDRSTSDAISQWCRATPVVTDSIQRERPPIWDLSVEGLIVGDSCPATHSGDTNDMAHMVPRCAVTEARLHPGTPSRIASEIANCTKV